MQTHEEQLHKLDETGLKTGTGLTIILLLIGFVLDSVPLVALVAVAQFMGALGLSMAPYRLVYQHILKPSGIAKPRIITDNPAPHRFAMLVGAIFNAGAVVALLLDAPLLAWILVAVVVVLANLNFWLNFCLGCWMYYRLGRLGVPGFTSAQIGD